VVRHQEHLRRVRLQQLPAFTPVDDFNLKTRALMAEQIAARTANLIARNAEAGRPFFTYVCFTQLHPPLIPHPEFLGKSGGGAYSDALAELDHRTGQVLDAIDQAGIADNTIVVWSSDNPAGRSISMERGPLSRHQTRPGVHRLQMRSSMAEARSAEGVRDQTGPHTATLTRTRGPERLSGSSGRAWGDPQGLALRSRTSRSPTRHGPSRPRATQRW
jgi:arylsulfatase A-like enzyme